MKQVVKLGLASVFDPTIAKQDSYLYVIYGAIGNRVALYVGQTKGATGALGRLSQHLSDTNSNTYLQRLYNITEFEEVLLDKVDFATVRFSTKRELNFDSREYREAVENHVQRNLLNWLHEHELKNISIVSRTRGNAYSKRQDIQAEANRICSSLEYWILERHQLLNNKAGTSPSQHPLPKNFP